MMKFNLDIDYKRKKEDMEKEGQLSNSELTGDYINYVVRDVHPNGIEGQLGRLWGRLQRKLLTALDNKVDTIEIEEAEIDFLKKCFDKVKYPAAISMFLVMFEDAFMDAVKESKDSKKDEKPEEKTAE